MNRDKLDQVLIKVNQGEIIPKKIHQTYKSKDISEPSLKANIADLKVKNPNWEYNLYDDADIEQFILSNYGEVVYSYYKRISSKYGAARADFFRYLLLYKEGGVYLDIKSSATKSLDEALLTTDKYILSHWDNMPGQKYEVYGRYRELNNILPRGEYQQWYIISISGHPFLREVILRVMENIDNYHPWFHGTGLNGVIKTTGPVPYTKAIYDCLNDENLKKEYRILDSCTDIGLEYSIYDRDGDLRGHRTVIAPYHTEDSSIILKGGERYMAFLNRGIKVLKPVIRVKERIERMLGMR